LISKNRNTFRTGILSGDKDTYYPAFIWILQRIPELRRRAYLAKYLIAIEVPPEMMDDPGLTIVPL
jgi:intraflagellar transport protein 81